ncbi:hypothetical protein FACS189413_14150 [Bacteroidia bacterium]|nr:hypothetical protein FACS189413_14150 [Bacteroidia bacterium]
MKYSILPVKDIVYKTPLSKDEVLNNLSANISKKNYIGYTSGNSFVIRRAIKYQNSFLPQITGEVKEDSYETRIHVKMKLHKPVFVLTVIWFCISFLACIYTTYLLFTEPFDLSFLMPHLMLIFVFLLFFGFFQWESQKSITDLKEYFEAELV